MQIKKFQRKIEDFVCAKCGAKVKGTGYTDHCPECLWSKHVDINPGDRQADCGGEMKPISIEIKGGRAVFYYKCQKCGLSHRVKAVTEDSMDAIINIIKADRLYKDKSNI
jgi:rubrerythrin